MDSATPLRWTHPLSIENHSTSGAGWSGLSYGDYPLEPPGSSEQQVHTLPWIEINASLMAATVMGAGAEAAGGRSCPPTAQGQTTVLRETVHWEELTGEVAQSESSSSGQKPAATPTPKGARPGRYSPYSGDSHCRRFNRGHCSASACRFDHVCSFRNATGHPVINCQKLELQRKARAPQAGQKPGPSSSQ